MEKKKLVFFSALPPYRGGISQFSKRLLSELELLFEVVPFTFKSQYPNWLFPGKTQYNLKVEEHKQAKRIVSTFNPISYISALKAIAKEKPQIFIVNYWMTFMSPMFVFWSKRLPKGTLRVAIIHNFIPHESRFFDRIFNKWLVNNYDLFIALSSQVAQDIKNVKPNAHVIHLPHPTYDHFEDAIDQIKARKKLSVAKDKKTLLFFGIIRDYKGLDILIRAFSRLPSDFQLIIAGEIYGSGEEYQLLIHQSTNQNIFLFNEFISDEEVHIFFSASDLCVLPYRSGTQSGVKAVADKMFVPTLISNVGGIAEKICDKHDGFIIQDISPENLSTKIEEIFKDSTLKSVRDNLKMKEMNQELSWRSFAKSLNEKIRENSSA